MPKKIEDTNKMVKRLTRFNSFLVNEVQQLEEFLADRADSKRLLATKSGSAEYFETLGSVKLSKTLLEIIKQHKANWLDQKIGDGDD